jgi:hypothetical protein
MELLCRFEGLFTEYVPVGLVPEGLRIDVHFEAQVTAGLLAGARVRGIDYYLQRTDGVGIIDVYATIEAGDGCTVSVHGQGYVVPPDNLELPPLEVQFSPDYTQPDLPFPIHGFALFRTGALTWRSSTGSRRHSTVM